MKLPVDKGWEEIRENVEDILLCELNKAEKAYISTHEKLEISCVEQLHQPIPTFIGRKRKGKYLSWIEYKDYMGPLPKPL